MAAWTNATTPAVRGLVRRAASTEAFDHLTAEPGDRLAPWVEHLWAVRWDLTGSPPVDSAVISFPAMHLTAEWGEPGELRHGHPLPATLVHGVVSRVFRLRLTGRGAVVGARFRPGALVRWATAVGARFTAAALTDRAVAAGTLLPPPLATLHTEIDHEAPPDTWLAQLRSALEPYAADAAPPDQRLTALVDRMRDDVELIRVDQLPALANCSLRTLQRQFRDEVGVSPKWVLARFRLQQAALDLERDPATELAALATRLGWYDQAHLTNDFRRMLGETPAAYARRAESSRSGA